MTVREISPLEADAKRAEGVVLIDVREPDEWVGGHAVGAAHHPLGSLSVADLPESGEVMFICAVGGRSRKAAEAADQAGWEAYNVAGGTEAWVRSGLPVGR